MKREFRFFSKQFVMVMLLGNITGYVCHAEDPRPITWALSAKTSTLPMRKGAMVQAKLHAVIQPGWHLYAMEQEPGGPTATKISMSPNQVFVLMGPIESETPPVIMNDPNFNLETRYYEGNAVFVIPIKTIATPSVAQGKLTVDVLFQTCNDRMCLPATVVHVSAVARAGH
jgi:hypothetical protein